MSTAGIEVAKEIAKEVGRPVGSWLAMQEFNNVILVFILVCLVGGGSYEMFYAGPCRLQVIQEGYDRNAKIMIDSCRSERELMLKAFTDDRAATISAFKDDRDRTSRMIDELLRLRPRQGATPD